MIVLVLHKISPFQKRLENFGRHCLLYFHKQVTIIKLKLCPLGFYKF